jgi:ribose/xylose/arabinose/galactoside ABC-type transport system permease subunit
MITQEPLPIDTKVAARRVLPNWLRNSRRALWPLITLLLIMLADSLVFKGFFNIQVVTDLENGQHFYGATIDIVKNAAPIILLAIGMSLVIATKGIDLSVGAVIAICGAIAATLVGKQNVAPIIPLPLIFALSIGAGALCGLWNGFLVAYLGIQPIVATLILLVAGRGMAQMITGATVATFQNPGLSFIGVGYIFGLPVAIYIALAALILVYVFVRRTALGMMIESVGANDKASYFVGINAPAIKLSAYVISGICAAVAGLIVAANIKGADTNNAGLYYELDAILAVVIGGASLNGGRFSLLLSAIGVLIIEAMNTGILTSGVAPQFNLTIKAIVVMFILFLQSESFRRFVGRRFRRTS